MIIEKIKHFEDVQIIKQLEIACKPDDSLEILRILKEDGWRVELKEKTRYDIYAQPVEGAVITAKKLEHIAGEMLIDY